MMIAITSFSFTMAVVLCDDAEEKGIRYDAVVCRIIV